MTPCPPTPPPSPAWPARSGYEASPRAGLREEYRRVTRRARRAFEAVFYGEGEGRA